MQPRAAVVVTGAEVLRGAVSDLNGAFLAQELEEDGVRVERAELLPDDGDAIRDAVRANLRAGFDLIVTTGGLGGTHDDLTMQAVAEACGLPLELREDALELVEAAYAGRRPNGVSARTQHAFEEKQATLPRGSTMIPPAGTAPGCAVELNGTVVVVLPGPPSEVREMWEASHRRPPIGPILARATRPERRILRLHNVVESQFMDALGDIPDTVLQELEIGVCARDGELEISVAGRDAEAVEPVQQALFDSFGERLYSTDGAGLVATVARLLQSRNETVSVAESCTAGGLGALITSVPGASSIFLGGVIAYGNSVKEAALGVSGEVIFRHGAVSPEAAEAMAEGSIRVTGSDWGLSITGIAGPGGGSADKPVGLVYVGVIGPGTADVSELRLRGTREQVRARAAVGALHALRVGIASQQGAVEYSE
ncbi:MAG: CinA family nicotinamide mononucleotide deamidase-related protein [Thermoleophilia bacterium]|nr:CinA family nicotinamide mononucleotide deamidase-related protein [Thermoleophilia bacterium]MDH3724948.1 CinA family nicotinamide mononucleotide deamidase-related protein [Thermoleophilia bacterium]